MNETPARQPEPNRTSWMSVVVIVLLLAGLGLTAYYGARVLRSAAQLRHMPLHPGETNVELIRGWMTVPYIARAYRVPEEVLWQGLDIPPEGNRHKSLRALDSQYAGSQPGVIIDKVRTIISTYESQHPRPSPTPRPNSASIPIL